MFKTPTKPLMVPLWTYRKGLIKDFISLGVVQKTFFFKSSEIMGCSELQRVSTSHFFTSGSEVRDYHCTEQVRDRGGSVSGFEADHLWVWVCVCVCVRRRSCQACTGDSSTSTQDAGSNLIL